ncbi:MAG: ABC transporter ATP-binding protein [Desulfuromonadaceae bacterium]|nr:ABC transporter ATP-binding protein [Desulfuromonas sp.]MDY0185603.1 ABC transporter ATP-binding protein [Desulfuromonadaceae bacterium]
MFSETSAEPIISLIDVSKCYQVYQKPHHRLLQMFARVRKRYFKEFWALRDVNLQIRPGEVVGIIGSNGAGKSTLLQLVCGTLTPSHGQIKVNGRIAALLELGAGFNAEFTGRENIYLSATIAGMSKKEIDAAFDSIVEFSGISKFIDQPVKTYSSGMYVRLAFSVAINVDPDILVIDEALAVGDGAFSRKSFERIMEMKKAGKTILFCSHALYQVEAICDIALWLKDGQIAQFGIPSDVVMSYTDYLNRGNAVSSPGLEQSFSSPSARADLPATEEVSAQSAVPESTPTGVAFISAIAVWVDDQPGRDFTLLTCAADVRMHIAFSCAPTLPMPHVAVCIVRQDGQIVASTATHLDNCSPAVTPEGGEAEVFFPKLALLRGTYQLDVYLMCENGIHVYDSVNMSATLHITQNNLELGVVSLAHTWS